MLEESGVWEEAEAGHRWLARFAQLCSGRGAEVWLEGGMSAGECVVGCAVSKLSSEGWPCPGSWRCVHVSRLGAGRGKWHPPALLFLENFPRDPCPSSTDSEIGKQISFWGTSGIFQTTACLQDCLFKGKDSVSCHSPGFPRTKPADL